MRYIFIVFLIFITNSCQTGTSDPTPPLIPLDPSTPIDPTIPLIPLVPSTPIDPTPPDPSIPTPPTFPDLEVNSWKYLKSSRQIGVTPITSEHITVSDNNTPYISFIRLSKLYVYRWTGSDWLQAGREITANNHNSLTTYNNIPYIAYEYNNQSFVKKFEGSTWVNAHNDSSLPTDNLNFLSLYAHKENLHLTYISDSDEKLHVKYLNNNRWISYGETPNDKFSGSMNNGIQMAFYGNTPYIALESSDYTTPRILVLKNNNWERVLPITPFGAGNINSDYFFYIDDKDGTMYLSFLVGFHPDSGSFQIFKKLKNDEKWQPLVKPFENQVFGYQTVLYQNQLYIAYSHSTDSLFQRADKVLFNRFSSSLGLEDIGKNPISDKSSKGSHVKLAIKDNRVFAMYVDFDKDSIVVKSTLLK